MAAQRSQGRVARAGRGGGFLRRRCLTVLPVMDRSTPEPSPWSAPGAQLSIRSDEPGQWTWTLDLALKRGLQSIRGAVLRCEPLCTVRHRWRWQAWMQHFDCEAHAACHDAAQLAAGCESRRAEADRPRPPTGRFARSSAADGSLAPALAAESGGAGWQLHRKSGVLGDRHGLKILRSIE